MNWEMREIDWKFINHIRSEQIYFDKNVIS